MKKKKKEKKTKTQHSKRLSHTFGGVRHRHKSMVTCRHSDLLLPILGRMKM